MWGLYFFVFLTLERLFLKEKLEKAPVWVSHVYLLFVSLFGWIIFRFRNVSVGFTVFRGMFGLCSNGFTSYEINAFFKNNIFFLVIAVVACTPLMKNLGRLIVQNARSNADIALFNVARKIAVPVVLLILSTFSLVGDSYNPFLYFQF